MKRGFHFNYSKSFVALVLVVFLLDSSYGGGGGSSG